VVLRIAYGSILRKGDQLEHASNDSLLMPKNPYLSLRFATSVAPERTVQEKRDEASGLQAGAATQPCEGLLSR
jgi:hypothetical protein